MSISRKTPVLEILQRFSEIYHSIKWNAHDKKDFKEIANENEQSARFQSIT